MEKVALKTAPAAVIAAFRHVQASHPSLAAVHYDADSRWCFTDLNGTAFEFGKIDVGLLEDAADALETVPVTFSLCDIVHSEGGLVTVGVSLTELYALWDRLGDVPTFPEGEQVDCIEEPFLHFPAGTHREDIWHWFESMNPRFLVGEVMQGVLHDPAPKQYKTDVRTDSDYSDIPEVVKFSIEEKTAQEIVRLAGLVVQNGLYKVEKFDYRATYLKHDPEDSSEDDAEEADDDSVSTDADTLNVTRSEFWFAAYLKHSDVEVLSVKQRISDLAKHFGIAFDETSLC